MKDLADEIISRCRAGQRVALCIVVASRGSTPQERGAKMLVFTDGKTLGTLGGGCVEAEVKQQTLKLLDRNESAAMRFSLDHDYGWDDGLICGGVMDIYVQIIEGEAANPFADISSALANNQSALIDFKYTLEDKPGRYFEELGPPPVLLIAGAGHVGQSLAKLGTMLDFQVDIVDDRADHATAERFPTARHRLVGDIETELRRYPIKPDTYVVVVTRGHRNDGRALAAVVNSPARYVGLIGSKTKIKTIMDDLAASGVDPERLLRVHAPIGFEIGAVTVPEIAISIAAELVAIRRGRENKPAAPMKMNPDELGKWLSRKR